MLRWPFELRLRGSPPAPPEPLLSGRPSTFIGLLSDLARDPKQAFTLAFAASVVMVVATLCVVGITLAGAFFLVVTAAKGIKDIPLHYILPGGISGASLITLVTILIRAQIKRRMALRADAADDGKQSGKP
jgi:hypothetical protein